MRASRGRQRNRPADHQVENQEEIAFQLEDDALAQPAETQDLAVFSVVYGRVDGPEEERTREAHLLEGLSHDPGLQRVDVELNIR